MKSAPSRLKSRRKRLALLAAVAVYSAMLGGCASLRPTQQAFAPDEFEVRHPIKLTDTVRHLDVFESGRQLDRRQHMDIVAFGQEYAASGRGVIHVALPPRAHAMLGPIRAALAESGARAPLQVTSYIGDPALGTSPVRLSFVKLEAKVASQCGQWPADLAGGKNVETWHNRPYHNLGCAYQTMIAAQVADPIDLVRPRIEGPVDTVKRTKDIEALRKDQDPSTKWAKDDVKVKDSQQ